MTFTARSREDIEASLNVAIQPSACGRHLVRHVAPEQPYFYLGDTAWELFHRLDDAEAEMFLRNRAEKGFTSIMVVVLAEHGGLDFPDRRGEWPFFPSAEATKDKYVPDLSKPNPGYFAFIDRILPLAASLGMTVSLVPTWGRYVNGGFYEKPVLFDEDKAYAHGKFLGNRYPFHPFILGGDSVRYWNPKTLDPAVDKHTIDIIDTGPVWEAMAKGLIEGEREVVKDVPGAKGYETFITYHSSQCWYKSRPEATSSAQFPDATWLSLDCVQSGHYNGAPPKLDDNGNASQSGDVSDALELWKGAASYEPIRKMYATMRPDGKPRPVIDLEPHYETVHYWWDYKQPVWTPDDIRSGAWQGVFAGACGYTYGCNSIWQMHNGESTTHPPIQPPTTAYTNWFLELDLSGVHYAAIMRRFFLTLPDFFTRRPDSSFIASSTNEPTDGTSALDTLIQGLRAASWVMVHLPYGGKVEIDTEKALGDGARYRAWWVNPRTGGKQVLDRGVKHAVEGVKSFQSPTEGALEHDWVLLLETYSM